MLVTHKLYRLNSIINCVLVLVETSYTENLRALNVASKNCEEIRTSV